MFCGYADAIAGLSDLSQQIQFAQVNHRHVAVCEKIIMNHVEPGLEKAQN